MFSILASQVAVKHKLFAFYLFGIGAFYAYVVGQNLRYRPPECVLYACYFGAVGIAFAATRQFVVEGVARWIARALTAIFFVAVVTFVVTGHHVLGILLMLLFATEMGIAFKPSPASEDR
jgi:hypothetical protein